MDITASLHDIALREARHSDSLVVHIWWMLKVSNSPVRGAERVRDRREGGKEERQEEGNREAEREGKGGRRR